LVITTAGTLVSLLFGLAAVVTSQKGFKVSDSARGLLLVGVGFFFVAAVAGLVANIPLRYREVDPASLRALVVPEHWDAPLSPGERNAASARLEVLERAQRANELKGRLVLVAFAAEVVAVGFVAAAVGVILV
jgi:hypothetical protein